VERHRKGEEGAGGWIDEEVEHPIASLLLYPLYIIFQGRAHLHLSLLANSCGREIAYYLAFRHAWR
jgi:hypothetical protein